MNWEKANRQDKVNRRTEPVRPKPIKANWSGTCAACGQPWKAGSPLRYNEHWGRYVHSRCWLKR